MAAERTLIICSKSRWSPPIRREHALARLAADRGSRVLFIEQPRDVRIVARDGLGGWLAGLGGGMKRLDVAERIEVIPRATVVPPHRGRLGAGAERLLLRRSIIDTKVNGGTVVATTPWQWSAVADLRDVRRVFDCADDWSALIPRRQAAAREQYKRIAAEADAIVVNRRQLAQLFGSRRVEVVPNGTSRELLAAPLSPPPQEPVIAYAGTMSERFDTSLVAAVLERLTGWRLSIYGECRYAGRGDSPSRELRLLLSSFPDRIAWHGPVERTQLAARLDAARVLVLPHRRYGAGTGEAMKLYDYAARGRPIVSTPLGEYLTANPPPGLLLADTPDAFAEAVRAAAEQPPELARKRRAWAEARSWERRWPSWASAIFGD